MVTARLERSERMDCLDQYSRFAVLHELCRRIVRLQSLLPIRIRTLKPKPCSKKTNSPPPTLSQRERENALLRRKQFTDQRVLHTRRKLFPLPVGEGWV